MLWSFTSWHDNDVDSPSLQCYQERRKKDREEEEKRMAEQRAAEDARRKAEDVSNIVF